MPMSTPANPSRTVPDGLREHELDGELTVFDPQSSKAVFLNRTATACWRHLDGTLSERAIVEVLASDFGKEPDSIEAGVVALLDRLLDLGLLEHRNPPLRRA